MTNKTPLSELLMSNDRSSRELACVLMEGMDADDIFEGLLGCCEVFMQIQADEGKDYWHFAKQFEGYYVSQDPDIDEYEIDQYALLFCDDDFTELRIYDNTIIIRFNGNITTIRAFYRGETPVLNELSWYYAMINSDKQLWRLQDTQDAFKRNIINFFKIMNNAHEI